LRGECFFFGNLHLQGGDLVLQRTLLGGLGLLGLALGLQPGVFDRLQFGGLLGGLAGHAVFFLLDARSPDRCDFTHSGAPGQILQLPLDGGFA
jgi:hypothetical protein